MKRTVSYTVESRYDGRQVKQFLKDEAGISSRLVKLLKRTPDGLLLNGAHVRTVDVLREGDTLTLNIPESSRPVEPSDVHVPVLYEDGDVIVFDKPPFMPVHPTRNHQGDTLANAFSGYLASKGMQAAFRAVNRLDRDTSGAVVTALNQMAASKLQASLNKTYVAIVYGEWSGSGTIDLPIYRPDPLLIRRAVGEAGERAVTHWSCAEVKNGMSMLKIKLETGRTHQIRVHFSHLGCPLVGDTMYGDGDSRIKRQALHCAEVEFVHPVTNLKTTVKSPLPGDIRLLFYGNL